MRWLLTSNRPRPQEWRFARNRRAALALVSVLVAVLLALPAAAQSPKRGGVLRIAHREAPNLDPHLSVSFLAHSWDSMVYSQLMRYAHGPEQKSPIRCRKRGRHSARQ